MAKRLRIVLLVMTMLAILSVFVGCSDVDDQMQDINDQISGGKDNLNGIIKPENPCEHEWLDATCSTPKTCSKCNATEGEKLSHVEVTLQGVAPTCTNTGLSEGKQCSLCNEILVSQETLAAKGHAYGAAATCTAPQTCTVCGTVLVGATGHTETTLSYVAPTCTQSGLTAGKKCIICGTTTVAQQTIAANEHSYTSVVTAPNCTSGGYTTYTCHCGYSYVGNETSKLGHSYNSVVTAPSCTNDGYTTHTCSRCNHSYNDSTVTAPGHKYDNACDTSCNKCGAVRAITHAYTSLTTNPTCTTQGYTTHTCSVCGSSYLDAYVNALGHKDTNKDHICDNGCGITQGEHTDGNKNHNCDYGCSIIIGICADTDKDHTCDYGCSATFGTCEDTNKDHKCDYGCSATFGTCEDTNKDHKCDYGCSATFGTHTDGDDNNHSCDYCDGAVEGEECFDTDGDNDHKCDECGEDNVTAHVNGEAVKENEKSPDCVNNGSYDSVIYCAECEAELSRTTVTIDANEHSYGEWQTTNPAKCTENGEARRDCSNCDHFETKVITAPGHTDTNPADYRCDVCDTNVCPKHEFDNACDTNCNVCCDIREVPDHIDANPKDHKCDICGANVGEHIDSNNDHDCDYGCSEAIGVCGDTNKDHKCDYGCDKPFGTHADSVGDGDHLCDYCNGTVDGEECHDVNTDSDHKCDECGKENVTEHIDGNDKDHLCDNGCGQIADDGHHGGAATCTKQAVCEECGESYGELLAHTYDQPTVNENTLKSAATCTAPAVYYYSCVCGDVNNSKNAETFEDGSALDHSFTNYTSNNDATCTQDGTKTAKCDRCSATDTKTVEKNPNAHTSNEFKYTSNDNGTHEKAYSCCGAVVASDEACSGGTATCTAKARCQHCGAEYGSTASHDYTETVIPATCKEQGYTNYDCKNCDFSYNDNYTELAEHSYNEGVVTAPTCTDKGYTTYTCSVCGNNYTDNETDALGHITTKFTGDFLYRVGNQNPVELSSLFDIGGHTVNNDSDLITTTAGNASGSYSNGSIKFSGTGVVKVTVSADCTCGECDLELTLEVVEAKNVTTAESATKNNIVLLQDIEDFTTIEVSGGYTLYGNGFKMEAKSDSATIDMGYAFVKLDNGTLDNVQIICPNFDYAVLYKSNMTESGNRSETTDKTRYYNVKSGVMVTGNSQILNSRISGARAAVNVTGGNCLIDNSRLEGGAVATLLVGSANSVTLRDVTLIQKPTASTYDSNKVLMGFSVLFICDADGNAAPITLEGTLVQDAWVDESDKQYVPSAGSSVISTVLSKTDYLHDIDGDGIKESVNLGFAYMPESLTSNVNATTITDNRTNKVDIPYDYAEITILTGKTYVYSYENSNGTHNAFKDAGNYVPNKYGDIITVNYSDSKDGLEQNKSYGTDGWVYELNVDLDKVPGYKLDFSNLTMNVNGVPVTDYKVNGGNKPSTVAVTAGGVTYTLTATIDGKEYTATFKVTGTETSKESPSKISGPNTTGFGVAKSYGSDWSGAADVLTGVKIKYWSVAENEYIDYDFSDLTVPGSAGKLNGTNSYWEYTHTNNDFTLKVTNTVAIHSSKSVYGMPILGTNGKLYFTISSTNGYVGSGTTSRAITMQYEFTDNNGGEKLTFTHTFNISYDKDEQYSYSDLSDSGKLTKLESDSGAGCVTPDTLITLADGTQIRMDEVVGDELFLVWNMETGTFDVAQLMFMDVEYEAEVEVVYLTFSDGTEVKVIYEHGFWDYDLNRYVYLDTNAANYIGHTFAKQNGDKLEKVQLVDVVIKTEVTTAWSPVTVGHLCYFVNGMLSMPGGVGGLFNIFEVDPETMTYDLEQMEKDIETYGLFTYEELNAICPLSEDMFYAAGGAYLKVSIGKGNLDIDELKYMIERYSIYFSLRALNNQ